MCFHLSGFLLPCLAGREPHTMPICPACTDHDFGDTSGIHTCPQCQTRINCTSGAVTCPPAYRHKFQHATKAGIRSQRNKLVLGDGNVACACCGAAHRLMDSVDGRIDTDGSMRVRVQEGWTLRGNVFEPHMTERHIPRAVRGQICPTCQGRYPVRIIGRMEVDTRPQRIRSHSGTDNTSDTWGRELDDTKRLRREFKEALLAGRVRDTGAWLHAGDPSTVTTSTKSVHRPLCECLACRRQEREVTPLQVRRTLQVMTRKPASRRVQCSPLGSFARLPESITAHISRHPRAIRGQRDGIHIGRQLTIADTLRDAVVASIAAGDAMGAYRYARMSARTYGRFNQ